MTLSRDIRVPTAFNPDECRVKNALEVSGNNLIVAYKGPGKTSSDAASIRTKIPIDPRIGVYYYEVTIIKQGKDGYIGIGLSKTKDVLQKLPGWEEHSFGYHGDDGHFFNSCDNGRPYGPTYTTNDVIGCGVNFITDECFFTKNGVFLGEALKGLPGPLYPTVGLRTEGEVIAANFGAKEMVFHIEKYKNECRDKLYARMQKVPMPPPHYISLQKLVKSYLVYHGYSKAADAFAQATGQSIKEELDSIKYRQEIRQLIIKGEISEAIKLTYCCYPHIFADNPELLFKLKCREFVIMVVKLASAMEQQLPETPSAATAKCGGRQSVSQLKLVQQQQPTTTASVVTVAAGSGGADDGGGGDGGGGGGGGSGGTPRGDALVSSPGATAAPIGTVGPKATGGGGVAGVADFHAPLFAPTDSLDLDVEMSEGPLNNSNGHAVRAEEERMEVCDTDTQNGCSQPEPAQVTLESVIQYGRELNKMAEELKASSKLSQESSRLVMDAFSLLAYKDLKLCPVQHLVEPQSRESIAANVNSAILITQNLPVQPPLEVCIRQLQFCMTHLAQTRHHGDFAFASAAPLYERSICNELRKS